MTSLEAQAIQPVLDMIQNINKPPCVTISDMKVMKHMKLYGGSFIEALADAAMKADAVNLWKIKAAFDDEWEEYRNMAIRLEQKSRPVVKCHPLSGMMEPPEEMEEQSCRR